MPRKYREQVASYISTRAYEEKFRIDKGLVGSAGAMKKAVRAVEALEEYAIEKIQQSRANTKSHKAQKAQMLDPIRENRRKVEKQRLVRRYEEQMAHSSAQMSEIQKMNTVTAKELERISRLEDPIRMFEERKEEQKEKYRELKEKLSHMTSLNGSMTVAKSPNGATELLESLFERNNNS